VFYDRFLKTGVADGMNEKVNATPFINQHLAASTLTAPRIFTVADGKTRK